MIFFRFLFFLFFGFSSIFYFPIFFTIHRFFLQVFDFFVIFFYTLLRPYKVFHCLLPQKVLSKKCKIDCCICLVVSILHSKWVFDPDKVRIFWELNSFGIDFFPKKKKLDQKICPMEIGNWHEHRHLNMDLTVYINDLQ